MEHSPLPWIMKKGTGLGTTPHFVGETSDGKNTPFQALKEADAAFIVRAVNCHDELVAALKSMYLFISTYGGEVTENFGGKHMANFVHYENLIAKAEGK